MNCSVRLGGRFVLLGLVMCLCLGSWAQGGAVLFTADTEGLTGPCTHCPTGVGDGSLARRATAIASVRQAQADGVVLVDAGNAFFGTDSIASRGRVIADVYDALAYDAVNISYRDFRLGRAALVELLQDRKFVPVSANLVDADSRKPLFRPYVVLGDGSEKVVVIGLTEAPAGMEFLPHLREQLAGVRIVEPAEALRDAVAKAKSEAGAVYVLYYGTPAGLAQVASAAEGVTAILVGGMRPGEIPAKLPVPAFGTDQHGKQIGSVSGTALTQVDVPASLEPDRAILELIASHRKPATAPAPPDAASRRPLVPADAEPGKVYPLRVSGANRGARLTVMSASVAESYGAFTAAPGRRLLVLSTEWENVIPWKITKDGKIPTAYRVPNLRDHLYLVLNDATVQRIAPTDNKLAGHVPVQDFLIEQIGDRLRGNLIFDIPQTPLTYAQLRFYDNAHGNMELTLIDRPTPMPVQPLSPPQSNEVVEMAAVGVKKLKQFGGESAPESMQFVVVDLRGRSLFMIDADATAFDSRARPGQKIKVGTVADWADSRNYIQLVVDGRYAYPPHRATELPETPRFLPDVLTGGAVAFLAPAQHESLELRCDFPNARTPSGVLRPKGLTLGVEGRRPAAPKVSPIATIDDKELLVTIAGQSMAASFAGKPAEDGFAFFVVDVVVHNRGKNGEHFQTPEMVKYVTARGQQVTIDPVSFEGPYRPTELIWIPAGEVRAFQAVYKVPANERKPRLAYRGFNTAEVVFLKPMDELAQ